MPSTLKKVSRRASQCLCRGDPGTDRPNVIAESSATHTLDDSGDDGKECFNPLSLIKKRGKEDTSILNRTFNKRV
jgi:hypothetical protein